MLRAIKNLIVVSGSQCHDFTVAITVIIQVFLIYTCPLGSSEGLCSRISKPNQTFNKSRFNKLSVSPDAHY